MWFKPAAPSRPAPPFIDYATASTEVIDLSAPALAPCGRKSYKK